MTLSPAEKLDVLEERLQKCFELIRGLRQDLRDLYGSPPSVVRDLPNGPLPGLPRRETPDPDWTPIYHRVLRHDSPLRPCGNVGLYLTEPPREGQNARLEVMRICPPGEQQWRSPQINLDVPQCDSCGAPIDPFSNRDLDYLSVMRPAVSPPTPSTPRSTRKREREKPGEDPDVPPVPDGSSGVGSIEERLDPPPAFPVHTFQSRQEVLQSIEDLAATIGL